MSEAQTSKGVYVCLEYSIYWSTRVPATDQESGLLASAMPLTGN